MRKEEIARIEECGCYDCKISRARRLCKTGRVTDKDIARHLKIKPDMIVCKNKKTDSPASHNQS